MKKMLSIILCAAMLLSLCACAETPDEITATAEPSIQPIIEDPEAGRSNEDVLDEASNLIFGVAAEKNIEKAIDLLLPLVESGDAEAQYYYAWIYDYEMEESDATEQESLYWYRLSAKQGYAKALASVALNSFAEEREIDDAAQESMRLLTEMTDEVLGTDGVYLLASMYDITQDYEKALEWYCKAAEDGLVPAKYQSGLYYYEGLGANRDYEKAYTYFHEAAESDDGVATFAMIMLGQLYQYGYGVEEDIDRAFEWYFKSAEAGNAAAMNIIGNAYWTGTNLELNQSKGREWLKKSAQAGNEASMNYVGTITGNMDSYIASYLNGYEGAIDGINKTLASGTGFDQYLNCYEELFFAAIR